MLSTKDVTIEAGIVNNARTKGYTINVFEHRLTVQSIRGPGGIAFSVGGVISVGPEVVKVPLIVFHESFEPVPVKIKVKVFPSALVHLLEKFQ